MPPRSYQSLLGILFGFLCIFPLLIKREKKAHILTSEVLLRLPQEQMHETRTKNLARVPCC